MADDQKDKPTINDYAVAATRAVTEPRTPFAEHVKDAQGARQTRAFVQQQALAENAYYAQMEARSIAREAAWNAAQTQGTKQREEAPAPRQRLAM